MRHATFTAEADALALESIVSHLYGLPTGGRHVGQGVHASDSQATTERIYSVRQHPSATLWAHPAPEGLTEQIAAMKTDLQGVLEITTEQMDSILARLAAAADLDSTWDPQM